MELPNINPRDYVKASDLVVGDTIFLHQLNRDKLNLEHLSAESAQVVEVHPVSGSPYIVVHLKSPTGEEETGKILEMQLIGIAKRPSE